MQDTVTERIMWGAVDIGTPKKNIHFVSRLMVLLKVSEVEAFSSVVFSSDAV